MRAHSVAILTAAILVLTATQATGAGNDALAWHSPMHPQFELATQLSHQLDLRFGINRFEALSLTNQLQSALADETIPTFSASALVDWQVLPGGLHLTGGALYGDLGWSYLEHTNGFAAERSYMVSSYALDRDRSRMDKIKPYLGLGWKNQFGPNERFRLQLDLGLVFQSVPPEGEGSLSSNYIGNSDDVRLGQTFQSFRYTPLFSAGFRYRF